MKIYRQSLVFVFALLLSCLCSTAVAQTQYPYTISGDVVDEFGKPAAGVRVYAYPDASVPNRSITYSFDSDEKGKFIIRLKQGGGYSLYPTRPDGYMTQSRPFYRNAPERILKVNPNADTPNVTVSLSLHPKSGAVNGKAIDAKTSLPVEHIQIALCKVDSPEICITKSSKTATGKFQVYGSLTPFTMKISADGYEDWLGATGTGEPINLSSGAFMEVQVSLKRRKETADLAMHDGEKKVGVHLPAPIQLAPAQNAKINRFPRATKLEWQPVEGAVSYTVEIDICELVQYSKEDCVNAQPHTRTNNPEPTGITGTSYEFNFGGANPGRWRVWAVDKEGRAGFKSPWRKFTYLR
jgi:hypothetical protein